MGEQNTHRIKPFFFERKNFVKYAMIIPTLAIIFSVVTYPFFISIKMSFVDWAPLLPSNPFIGIDNYVRVLSDSRFWNSIKVTFTLIGVALPAELGLGFAIALFFNRKFVGKKIYFSLLILPLMISLVIVGLTTRMAFDQYYGFVNDLIRRVTGRPFEVEWFTTGIRPLAMLIIADIWRWTPFVFLVLLAGLESLPVECYESTQVDGANRYQTFIFITLPQMKYCISVVIFLRFLELLRFFDIGMMTTRGGPGIDTETISIFIYEHAFTYWELGFAATTTIVLLWIVMGVIMVFARLLVKET